MNAINANHPPSVENILQINSLEHLRHQFISDKQQLPKHNLFLIFDHNIATDITSMFFRLDEAPEYYPLFLGTHLEQHIVDSPYLIKINNNSLEFSEWFFTHSKQWGFFYLSTHSLDNALAHWQNVLFVETDTSTKSPNSLISNGDTQNMNYLLRFYDAKVLQALMARHYQESSNALTPCELLYYQDSSQTDSQDSHYQWVKHNIHSAIYPTPKTQHNILDDADHFRLNDLCVDNIAKRCEIALWDTSPRLVAKFSHRMRKKALKKGVDIALQAGFHDQSSILLFLNLWLERGPKAFYTPENIRYLANSDISAQEKALQLETTIPETDTWNDTDVRNL
ncbi:MAG: hypothetical protein COA99_03715 [Moraxellaceae bacterium]|nr:MAG: hypothetical protein COA99_03715 [Moraxellaceae bacterium]